MKAKDLIHHFPILWQSKDTILYVSVFTLLLLFNVFSLGKLSVAYQEANKTQQKVTSMTQYVEHWNEKISIIDSSPYRPVTAAQADNVQSNLLLDLQANNLRLVSFKNSTSSQKENSKKYQLDFIGTWPATIHFIQNFHVRDALISITQVNMKAEKDQIKTSVEYKVWVR